MAEIYRGRIEAVHETSIEVSQLEGYDYGQDSIRFHFGQENVSTGIGSANLMAGAYIQVQYNGILTRSMPPQGKAQNITVLSRFSSGVVVNGVIEEVQKTEKGYTLRLFPISSVTNPSQASATVMHVQRNALEHMTDLDIVVGKRVSAVTTGAAVLSQPPQMSALVLLPYTWPTA